MVSLIESIEVSMHREPDEAQFRPNKVVSCGDPLSCLPLLKRLPDAADAALGEEKASCSNRSSVQVSMRGDKMESGDGVGRLYVALKKRNFKATPPLKFNLSLEKGREEQPLN